MMKSAVCIGLLVVHVLAGGGHAAPEEGVGVGDAVWRYTQRSAEAVGLGDVSGSIAVGKLADVILLDRDIFAIPPEEIDAARVLATFVSGEAIFDSGQECC